MTADLVAATKAARSLLFVPGTRADRFAKAVASGADAIIIDLEDAVGAGEKDQARAEAHRWRAAGNPGLIRINDADSPCYESDVAALAEWPGIVMLPKVTHAGQVEDLWGSLPPGSGVVPLLESADAILNAPSICAARGVVRVAFGNGDLARALGVSHADRQALLLPRSMIVLAAAAHRLPPPLDGVTTSVRDAQIVHDDARHAASLGFSGKMCIHPAQVPVVNAAFSPTAEEIDWAEKVLRAAATGAVGVSDDEMIDRPFIERARNILHRAHRRAGPSGPSHE